MFIAFSLLDIVIASINLRFYTELAFVVTFGVGGVFAAFYGYFMGMEQAEEKHENARAVLILTLIGLGLIFFFVLSQLEGGEYEIAFKAFGATMALGSLLFVSGKPY